MERLPIGRMRTRVTVLVALLAVFALPAILLAQALETTFADLKGEVQWSTAGSTQWETASSNVVLHAGDRVRTGANSSARLAFYEGSTTDLAASTGARIDALQQADNENQITLSQTSGASQAQVVEPAAGTTRYQVETPASEARAPASTCPWVRVAANGTTLVRNYRNGVQLQVASQPVQQVIYSVVFVPGFGGFPTPVRVPQLVTVMQDMPAPTTPDEQPLINCRFGSSVANVGDTDMLASNARVIPDIEAGRLVLASLHHTLDPRRVVAQGGAGPDLTVANTSGARTDTVSVPPGNETQVTPGQPPSAPAPIGTFAAVSAAQAASAAASQEASQAAGQAGAMAAASTAAAGASAAQAAAQAGIAQELAAQQFINALSNRFGFTQATSQAQATRSFTSSSPTPSPTVLPPFSAR
jgi:hypothetical protein